MKKLLTLSLMCTNLFFGIQEVKADYDYWSIKADDTEGLRFYTVESSTGNATLRNTIKDLNGDAAGNYYLNYRGSYYDEVTNKFVHKKYDGNYYSYDLENDTWTNEGSSSTRWIDSYESTYQIESIKKDADGNTKLEFSGQKLLEKKLSGEIQIGGDENDIDITAEGLNIDGNPLITKKDNGEIHIGKNSLITKSEEETLSDGTKVQPLYAKDADGNKIAINIDGSKLLIDGVEVTAGGDSAQITTNKNNISTNASNISTNASNINNLGKGVAGSTALTAALSALPQTSKESKLSCGVGNGAYSSRYAIGFGCASKVNERVDINAGGSYVFGGSKSYGGGTLDSGVIKAGFVFKLGELNKSTQISMKAKEKMEAKILLLEENNNKIISQNEDLKQKNQSIISQNKSLLARLEKLEKIALGESKSKNLASINLP